MYNLDFEDDQLVNEAVKVIEQSGISLKYALELFFAKINLDKNLDFLLNNNKCIDKNTCDYKTNSSQSLTNMTKSKAINLFNRIGYNLNKYTTFASKNKTTSVYWANTDINFLEHDWYLILNDYLLRKLYLFKIPANHLNNMAVRSDKHNLLNIQIKYQNSLFTDIKSNNNFKKYLIETINY